VSDVGVPETVPAAGSRDRPAGKAGLTEKTVGEYGDEEAIEGVSALIATPMVTVTGLE
jgi:hypothetical protein